MAKISLYPDGGALQSTDQLVVARTGSNKSILGSNIGGGLTTTLISPTTANVSAVAGKRYIADISGLTANRNFTLPTPAVGNEIELNISITHATLCLIIIGTGGVTINHGGVATEWSRLFLAGETIHLVADTVTNWQVTFDGRIPCYAEMNRITSDVVTNSAGVDTVAFYNNVPLDNSGIANASGDANVKFTIRRANKYMVSMSLRPSGAVTDQKYLSIVLFNGATQFGFAINRVAVNGAAALCLVANARVTCVVGDTIIPKYNYEEANKGFALEAAGVFGQNTCKISEMFI